MTAALPALGQAAIPAPPTEWRRIGSPAAEISLASPASGPVDRVWFSPDGAQLYAKTRSGRTFKTSDFENWQQVDAAPPPADTASAPANLPESGSTVRIAALDPTRLYATGTRVWRSDDGGGTWRNLTAYRQQSIIGAGTSDLAISPRDPDEVVVANDNGVWRSLDGGVTWAGLNEGLPNLPARRLLALPQGPRGVTILTDGLGMLEWPAGERQAWRPAPGEPLAKETAAEAKASGQLGVRITAVRFAGDFAYAGSADGRLWVSTDGGATWRASQAPAAGGAVQFIWSDVKDGRIALAALSGKGPRVLRTVNGGLFWEDLTSDLPEGAAHGITADRASGYVYVATDSGIFFTPADLLAAAPATNWTQLAGLPQAPVYDVRLDADGNQLYAALDGFGVYATLAPHRRSALRVVNAADLSSRAAAPGSLLSVIGGRVQSARAGALNFPVLAASDTESQIQVPFEASGASVSLALTYGRGAVTLGLPIQPVSPAIFVDREGAPMLLDADSGLMLDASQPARAGGRIQIFATGLGKVQPAWPTATAAPLDNPPRVVAQVRAYLDRSPVEVTRAILAPGYIGFYLIEVQLPGIVNAGSAELYIEADGQPSNKVRLYLEN